MNTKRKAKLAIPLVVIAATVANSPLDAQERRNATKTARLLSTQSDTIAPGSVAGFAPPTVELVPVASHPDGPYNTDGFYTDANIVENRLTVTRGGGRTYWNMRVHSWGSGGLASYEGCIDAETLHGENAECGAGSGSCPGAGDLSFPAETCDATTECVDAYGELVPLCRDGVCEPAWVNTERSDWVHSDAEFGTVSGCGLPDPTTLLCFGAVEQIIESRIDDERAYYAATFVIDVPEDAKGLYTIKWYGPDWCTFLGSGCVGPPDCGWRFITAIPGELYVQTGACCLGSVDGGCIDDLSRNECDAETPTLETFHADRACSEVFCNPRGACCKADPLFPSAVGCSISVLGDCDCPTCDWTIGRTCGDVDCRDFIATIKTPAMSQWSVAILALTLLSGLAIKFSNRYNVSTGKE